MWSFLLRAFMVLYIPLPPRLPLWRPYNPNFEDSTNREEEEEEGEANGNHEEVPVGEHDDARVLDLQQQQHTTTTTATAAASTQSLPQQWFEEQLEPNLKWSFALNRVLGMHISPFQDIKLLDTRPFGKVLVIDGKLQSAESDEFIYHESLVHPALLLHHSPKTVFIMGGGEGSTAREVLKHRDIEKVVMCDIDRVVVEFCRSHLTANEAAFNDERLQIVFNDAKAELESRRDYQNEKFDVIIGDLGDPLEGGPCNHLYTKSFYGNVIKPILNHRGIFVTQAGPAGILTHKDIFTTIYNTLIHVFNYVIAYTAHVPSYADSCGWVLASAVPLNLNVEQIESRIRDRITGELRYLDAAFIVSSTVPNKTLRTSLLNETHIYTEENARFIHGCGVFNNNSSDV